MTDKFNEALSDVIKITYIGDITSDRPLLRALEPNFDFNIVFDRVREMFSGSDEVVANLETVCAGEEIGFQNRHMSYNTPATILEAMKKANINVVSTANNHCLDQGFEGIYSTLDYLDQNNILHVGTNRKANEDGRVLYENIKGRKIAFLSYTYSTNESNTGIVLTNKNDYYVNLLREQQRGLDNASLWKCIAFKVLSNKQRLLLKRIVARAKLLFGIPFMTARFDFVKDGDLNNKYLDDVVNDIKEAKKNAEFVILLVHAGGQFNDSPGEYCQFLVRFLIDNGADLVVENHPHVIQKLEFINDKMAAFSLGSFNMSCSSDYVVKESLPQYSVALHQYIEGSNMRYTFSILKNVESKDGKIVVWPIDKLYDNLNTEQRKNMNSEVAKVYERITGKKYEYIEPKPEFAL